jgi:hypothetical protein
MNKISKWLISLTLLSGPMMACANTDAPPGIAQASFWVPSCLLLDRRTGGAKLTADEDQLASFCLGAFTGIMAVNYISPPFLPFCDTDDARRIDYVRIFLRFMEGHTDFAQKQFGMAVLVALTQAHPKSECEKLNP